MISLLWPAIALCQTPPAPAAPAAVSRDQQCQDILEKALKDKNPDTRKQAAIALSLVGSTDPFPSQLESLLDDKDVEVRLAAVASLSDLKNSRTIPALHKALNDEVPEVSFAAARSLWALHDPEGKKALLSILSGESKASSGYFAKQKRDALRMMHTPKPMFLFAVRTGVGFAPVPGLGRGHFFDAGAVVRSIGLRPRHRGAAARKGKRPANPGRAERSAPRQGLVRQSGGRSRAWCCETTRRSRPTSSPCWTTKPKLSGCAPPLDICGWRPSRIRRSPRKRAGQEGARRNHKRKTLLRRPFHDESSHFPKTDVAACDRCRPSAVLGRAKSENP